MLHHKWPFCCLCVVTLLLLSVGCSTQIAYLPSILNDYGCSPKPCWRGIYPRTQSLKEAVAILHSYSDLKIDRLTIDETDVSIICWEDLSFPEQSGCFSSYKGQNAVLDLYSPLSPFGNKPLSFFDTIFLLGIPTGVDFCYIGEDFVNKPRAYATMFFDGGIQVLGDIYDLYKGEEPRLRATMTVHQIRYNVPSDETVQKWQGFGLLTNVNGC